jgi:hypothetical protein
LAEDEDAFVAAKGDFVVVVESAAVVDPAVTTFDDSPAWLDDEAAAGFRPGHHAIR